MSSGFDPYHKWLGIPPKDQPPHHYRLLGIELFESDLDVIEHAADQRMRHVRSFQHGPHQAQSQQLLNEIAAAKICLLDPYQKAAYDAQFQLPEEEEELRLLPEPLEELPSPLFPAPSAALPLPLPAPVRRARVAAPPKNPVHEFLKIAGGGLAGIFLGVIVLGFIRKDWDMLGIGKAFRSDDRQTIQKPREQVIAPVPPPAKQATDIANADDSQSSDDTYELLPGNNGPGKKKKKKNGPTVAPMKKLSPLVGEVTTSVFTWERGNAEQSLGPARDSFVTLSWLAGYFLGNGEWVQAAIDENQQIVLRGGAAQDVGGAFTRVRTPYRAWFEDQVQTVPWKPGDAPIQLIHQHDGFAMLAGVQGCFLGPDQGVEVYLDPRDGFWYLHGHTNFLSAGQAHVYRFQEPGKFRAKVTTIDWPGSEQEPRLSVTQGLCFISAISGRYMGYGESLQARVGPDGLWRAWGSTRQPTTTGKFIQIEFNTPELLSLAPRKPNLTFAEEPQTSLPTVNAAPIPVPVETQPAPIAPPKRRSPPAEAELTSAKAKVAEIYRDEHVKAKTLQQKLALCEQMRAAAKKIDDDPAGQFALFVIARDIAAGAGDWQTALQTIGDINLRYDIDPFAMADEVRVKIDAADKPPQDPRAAYQALIELTAMAEQDHRYELAERLIGSAQRIVRRAGDTQTLKLLTEYTAELQKKRRQYEVVKPSLARLATNPTDAAANEAVGRYRAFGQDNWDEGLPLFAQSADPELAKLAKEELNKPQAGTELLALADHWWDLADQRKADAKPLRRHALDCYLQASHKLGGLQQRQALSRLEEAEKWHSKEATYTTSPTTNPNDRRYPPLPSLLTDAEQYHTDETQFAFHLTGANTYITIDLKRDLPISRLHILNRQGNSQRAQGMTVYVSKSPQQRGTAIWRAPDSATEWDIRLPKLAFGRYVTIAFDPTRNNDAFLHLRKVKIYGPE